MDRENWLTVSSSPHRKYGSHQVYQDVPSLMELSGQRGLQPWLWDIPYFTGIALILWYHRIIEGVPSPGFIFTIHSFLCIPHLGGAVNKHWWVNKGPRMLLLVGDGSIFLLTPQSRSQTFSAWETSWELLLVGCVFPPVHMLKPQSLGAQNMTMFRYGDLKRWWGWNEP